MTHHTQLTHLIDNDQKDNAWRRQLLTQLWRQTHTINPDERRDLARYVAGHRLVCGPLADEIAASGDIASIALVCANPTVTPTQRKQILHRHATATIVQRALTIADDPAVTSQLCTHALDRLAAPGRGHVTLADALLPHAAGLSDTALNLVAVARVTSGQAPSNPRLARALEHALERLGRHCPSHLITGVGPWTWPAALARSGAAWRHTDFTRLLDWLCRQTDQTLRHSSDLETTQSIIDGCAHAVDTMLGSGTHADTTWLDTVDTTGARLHRRDLAAALASLVARHRHKHAIGSISGTAESTVPHITQTLGRSVQRREHDLTRHLSQLLLNHPHATEHDRIDAITALCTLDPQRALEHAQQQTLTRHLVSRCADMLDRHRLLDNALDTMVRNHDAADAADAADVAIENLHQTQHPPPGDFRYGATGNIAAANTRALLTRCRHPALAGIPWPVLTPLADVHPHVADLLGHWQQHHLTSDTAWAVYWDLAASWTGTCRDLFATLDALNEPPQRTPTP